MNYLFNSSKIPDSYYDKTFLIPSTQYEANCFDILASFRESVLDRVGRGDSLYIHSMNCGNGKTSWAISILKEYLYKIWKKSQLECRALFVSVPKYLYSMKDNINSPNEYYLYMKENIPKADIVIWDDIATKGSTEFERENLFFLIDDRFNNLKSNIFTSNVKDEKQLFDLLGSRLGSRIIGYSYDIYLDGNDMRALRKNRW